MEYLDDNSQTTFYLAASKGSDTIEVAYLNGVDTPYIDQMEGFSVDGVTTKVRIDAGVGITVISTSLIEAVFPIFLTVIASIRAASREKGSDIEFYRHFFCTGSGICPDNPDQRIRAAVSQLNFSGLQINLLTRFHVMGFSVDGVTTKVRIDAGVAPVDHRGLVKCTA